MDLHLPQSHPLLADMMELSQSKVQRGLDGQGTERTTGRPLQNMTNVEAIEVAADVAEASQTGLSGIFSDEEWATEGH